MTAASQEDWSKLPRRERERLMRRREMLRAAREVFAERGFVRATLDEIAMRAEFGKGTLYNYFPDGKEELLREVLDELFTELGELIEPFYSARVETTEEFRTELHAYMYRCASYFFQHQIFFRLLIREAWRLRLSSVEQRRRYVEAQVARYVSKLTVPIQRAIDAGALKPFPSATLAHLILAGVPNHIATFDSEGWPDDPVSAAAEVDDFLTSLLMDGISP